MYNGIGLQTARGSGTNGYVQRNLSFVRVAKPKVEYKTEDEIRRFESEYTKPPNQEILEHHRKRKIEVQCLELEEQLEKEELGEEEIQKRVDQLRQDLTKRMEKALENRREFILEVLHERGAKETHQLAELNQERNGKLKSALGINANFVEGSSMDFVRKAKEQQAEREEKLRANKDLIAAKIKEQSGLPIEAPPSSVPKSKRVKKRDESSSSDTSSDSESSDSSDSSNSSDSEDSEDSSSNSSSSSSSDSERDSRKRGSTKIKSRRHHAEKNKENSSRKRAHSPSRNNRHASDEDKDRNFQRQHQQPQSRRSVEHRVVSPRRDSLPRKYSRHSPSRDRSPPRRATSYDSDTPPKRQLQSFVSSRHRPSPVRHQSKSNSKERSSLRQSRLSRSPVQRNRSSRSRSNSPVAPSRRRERSHSRSVSPKRDRSYNRRPRNSPQPSPPSHSRRRNASRSQSRSISPRYRKDQGATLARKRSISPHDRYRRSTEVRRRSPSSSVSRSPSGDRNRSPSVSSKSDRSSRSPSIPKRRSSPSFREKRRITSARKLPVPYRRTDSSSPATPWSPKSVSTPLVHRNVA